MTAKPKLGAIYPREPRPHSFADNLGDLKSAFPVYPDGLSWKTKKGKRLATIASDDPVSAAIMFAGLASSNFVAEQITSKGYRRKMADGTIIGLRLTTSSDGSPAVDLNIINESHIRKIHFTLKGGK